MTFALIKNQWHVKHKKARHSYISTFRGKKGLPIYWWRHMHI